MVILGANEKGEKEPLTIVEGYRESTESWSEVLRDLKARCLTGPKLFCSDGVLGLWGAIDKIYPKADHQRCWVHKMRNALNHFLKRLQGEVKGFLQRTYKADARNEAEMLMAQFAETYRQAYTRAVECLLKDKDALLTYFAYPKER